MRRLSWASASLAYGEVILGANGRESLGEGRSWRAGETVDFGKIEA